jgi:HTH-type transcriptional regulator, sugar sensing transcriptional regulator
LQHLDEIQLGVFGSEVDSSFIKYKLKLDKIKDELAKFGLSSTQAKVYTYLGKYGPKSAPEVFKSLDLPRTEAYYILNTLQNKGIVTAECSSPTRYVALSLEQAISTLIDTEKEKINMLTEQKEGLAQLWEEIPSFAIQTNDVQIDRLQMMEGGAPIYSKIKNMIKSARKQICLCGSERDIGRFYHADIIEMISNSLVDINVILSPASKIPDFLKELDKNKIRLVHTEKDSDRCFIIKDDDEVVLFLRNATHHQDSVFAIWSNSKSLISSIRQLFDYSWESAKVPSYRRR